MNNPREEVIELTGDYGGSKQLAEKEVRGILEIIDELNDYQDQRPFWTEVLSIFVEENKKK